MRIFKMLACVFIALFPVLIAIMTPAKVCHWSIPLAWLFVSIPVGIILWLKED